MNVFWTLPPQRNQAVLPSSPPPPPPLRFAFSYLLTQPDQWAAIAFPATPNTMLGSSAAIAKTCSTCLSGASIDNYQLNAKSTAGVQPPSLLPITNMTAATLLSNNSVLFATFTVQLPDAYISYNNEYNSVSIDILLAHGPTSPDTGDIQYHSQRGGTTLLLTTTIHDDDSQQQQAGIDQSKQWSRKGVAHAWSMTIGFGVLMPIGVLGAVGLRSPPEWWQWVWRRRRGGRESSPSPSSLASSFSPPSQYWFFQWHRGIMLLSFATVTAGISLGFSEAGGWDTPYTVHRSLGVTAFVLAAFQVTGGLLRPHKDNRKVRKPWNYMHHFIGRSAVILAVANMYYGMIRVQELERWTYVTYSVVLGVLVGVYVGLQGGRGWWWWWREKQEKGSRGVYVRQIVVDGKGGES